MQSLKNDQNLSKCDGGSSEQRTETKSPMHIGNQEKFSKKTTVKSTIMVLAINASDLSTFLTILKIMNKIMS